jgi:exodeoxyribonuclease VII small subunit
MAGKAQKAEEAASEGQSFEELLAKLEGAVRDLEEGELSLDDSLKKYVEAVETYRVCRRRLEEAQRKIEVLIEEAGGERRAAAFEIDEDADAGDKS